MNIVKVRKAKKGNLFLSLTVLVIIFIANSSLVAFEFAFITTEEAPLSKRNNSEMNIQTIDQSHLEIANAEKV